MADDRLSVDEQVEIVCLMLDREQEGIVRILRAYAPRVKKLLLDHFDGLLTEQDAEEVIQTAVFKVWSKASTFDDKKGGLGGWFYIIARRSAIDLLRGLPSGEDRPVELSIDPSFAPRTPAFLDDAEDLTPEIVKVLLEEIETMGEKQKQIIRADLEAGGKADTEFLAYRLGLTKQHVHSYRNKAHTALKKRLARRGYTAEALRTKP